MYFKLALQNVKKSYKDYLIYFLTLAFSVCLFYTFNSFQDQQAMMDLSDSQDEIITSLASIMTMLSTVVAMVLAFLILYANNFLIKRRKKEFGLYTLLGMPKGKISRVLVYETFFIGLLSLIIGMILGLLASQLLTVVTANLFSVILNYEFVFSMDATVLTIVSFAIIFFIVMMFNSLIINKYKLIDLLNADRKQESFKVKNVKVSVLLFIISIILLGGTYYVSWVSGYEAILMIMPIGFCGILGTILFFMSLSGFLLKFIQTSKSLYLKKLNMFMLRQINANINSNFLSMSIVCIMLLFSIGALSTGINLNATFNRSIEATTPYDYSYADLYQNNDLKKEISTLQIDKSQYIEKEAYIETYVSDIVLKTFAPYIVDADMKYLFEGSNNADEPIEIVPLSEYNNLLQQYNKEPIALNDNQGHLMTSASSLAPAIDDIIDHKPELTLYGNSIKIINDTFEQVNACTTNMSGTFIISLVVPDAMIPVGTTKQSTYYNVDLKEDIDTKDFGAYMLNKMDEHNASASQEDYKFTTFNANTSLEVKEASKGLAVIFTYIGIYLGIVFLIASTVILALQQLSQANDNKARYAILAKIGAEKKMMDRSILSQLGIYFFMPLLLAICHSIIGIHVVNGLAALLGSGDLFVSSLYTAGIIILIYGSYFAVTYSAYKSIIKQ